MLRKIAFNLQTLMIHPTRETPGHLRAILTSQRWKTAPATVHGNHRRANPQVFAGQAVVRLRIEGGSTQQSVKMNLAAGLQHRWRKMRRIIIRAARDDAGAKQMRLNLTYRRDFRPVGVTVGAFSPTLQIMGAEMMAFEAGAVDSPLGRLGDHLEGLGAVKNGVQEVFKSPFFSNRRSA